MRTRLRRATCVLFVASFASLAATASADEKWSLDPGGEWTATEQAPAPRVTPPRAAESEDDPLAHAPHDGEDSEDDEGRRRSPAAMAGGIVVVSISGLAALYGSVVAIGFKGYEAGGFSHEERVTGYTLLGLGLSGTAGGIALIAWGAHHEKTATNVWAGPGRVGVSGAF